MGNASPQLTVSSDRNDYAGLSRSWRSDVVAGLTVSVVALPLALAFGITTGLGAEVGLAMAIVAGLLAALLGGSDVQVSGPTGAWDDFESPLEDPARDTGSLQPFRDEVRRLSRRSRVLVPEHLETLEP